MIDQSLVGSFVYIAIFIIAMLSFLFFFKKMLYKKNSKTEYTSLKIISKLPLSSKNFLYIIQVNNKILLLGATEQNIRLLADLTSSAQSNSHKLLNEKKQNSNKIEQPKSSLSQKFDENSTSFSTFLKQAFKRSTN